MFKNILKAIGSGILDAIPIVPNFLDRAKMRKDKEAIRSLIQDKAKAISAKNVASKIQFGSTESAQLIPALQKLLDTIDDGEVNGSIPEDRAEKIVRGLTTVITGGLIAYGFIQQVINLF